MKKSYEKFTEEELILRDHLALDRTVLANERTFLSYIRTTLAIVVVGATLIHLTDDALLQTLGILSIMSGVVILIVGIQRTIRMSEKISSRKKK